ncbi:MFS transporter [Spirulina sp. 06S082]|uniref:MFS transporter n=1 Tax=Spirulina sp. 06S082 TaxID=3110248 RepID=UPI002B1FFC8D|nr:MFS transporter [Spirulina sp. 06S082]MEA5470768.1 MFS transporter [Spirulina sp. 06S082]
MKQMKMRKLKRIIQESIPNNLDIAWKPFLLCVFMGAAVTISSSSSILQFHQQGWSTTMYSWVVTASISSAILALFLLNITATWVIRTPVLIGVYFLMIFSTICLSIFRDTSLSWIIYAGVRGLIFNHCYHVLYLWVIHNSFKENHAKLFYINYVGLCIGNFIGPPIVSFFNIENTTFFLLTLTYIFCIMLLFFRKIPKLNIQKVDRKNILRYLKISPLLWILCGLFGMTEVAYSFIVHYGFGLEFTESQSLWLTNALLLGAIGLGYPLSATMDKFKNKNKFVLWIMLFLLVLMLFLIGLPHVYWVFSLIFVIVGGIFSLLAESGKTFVMQQYNKQDVSSGFILATLFDNVGRIICTQIMGRTMDRSETFGFIGTLVSFLVIAIAICAYKNRRQLKWK